jgi:hypothetical protein
MYNYVCEDFMHSLFQVSTRESVGLDDFEMKEQIDRDNGDDRRLVVDRGKRQCNSEN